MIANDHGVQDGPRRASVPGLSAARSLPTMRLWMAHFGDVQPAYSSRTASDCLLAIVLGRVGRGAEVAAERVVGRIHERPFGLASGGFLFGHLRLSPFCAVVLGRLGSDADHLADGFRLARRGEHVVGDVGAGDAETTADVAADGGAVVAGERLAGQPWRAEDGPVQPGVAQ